MAYMSRNMMIVDYLYPSAIYNPVRLFYLDFQNVTFSLSLPDTLISTLEVLL